MLLIWDLGIKQKLLEVIWPNEGHNKRQLQYIPKYPSNKSYMKLSEYHVDIKNSIRINYENESRKQRIQIRKKMTKT